MSEGVTWRLRSSAVSVARDFGFLGSQEVSKFVTFGLQSLCNEAEQLDDSIVGPSLLAYQAAKEKYQPALFDFLSKLSPNQQIVDLLARYFSSRFAKAVASGLARTSSAANEEPQFGQETLFLEEVGSSLVELLSPLLGEKLAGIVGACASGVAEVAWLQCVCREAS